MIGRGRNSSSSRFVQRITQCLQCAN